MIKGTKELSKWFQRQSAAFGTALDRVVNANTGLGYWVMVNSESIWSTRGAAIGENWGDRTLIQTGLLRTEAASARVSVEGSKIVITHGPDYAGYVARKYRFSGLSDRLPADAQLGAVIVRTALTEWRYQP